MADVKTVFGETLKKCRAKSGQTQQDVAMSCEMSLRFYQDLEAGNKQASITTVFRLADSLNVTPNELILPAYKSWKSSGGKEADERTSTNDDE
ncbi:helix-turn-helix domain-containing protein [Aurantivibrio plasticivorans]